MTYGTAKVYKTSFKKREDGTEQMTLGITLSKVIVEAEKLERGCTIQIDVKRLDIPIRPPRHKGGKLMQILQEKRNKRLEKERWNKLSQEERLKEELEKNGEPNSVPTAQPYTPA